MKLKDIFSHPWVVELEKEAKEAKLKSMNANGSSGNSGISSGSDINSKLMAGILGDEFDQPKKNHKIVISSKDVDGSKSNGNDAKQLKEDLEDKDSADGIDIDFKVKKKKKKGKKEEKEEIVIPGATGGGGDFFDSVLGKVKDKNKGKINSIT
jgi:hypothetical protein